MILSFSISNIQQSSTIDANLSIVDNIVQPFVTTSVENSDIPLYYYGISARDISDYVTISEPDFGNNRVKITNEFTNIIEVNTSNVLITDITNSYVDETIPLWWQHYTTSNTLLGVAEPVSMVLFDDALVPVDQRLWKYDQSSKTLYSSVNNKRDPETVRHIVYYVQTSYDDGQVVTELLNAQPVYRKSTSVNIAKKYYVSSTGIDIIVNISGGGGVKYIREVLEDTCDIKIFGSLNSTSWRMAVKNDLIKSGPAVYSLGGSYLNDSSFDNDVSIVRLQSQAVQILEPTLLYVDLPGRLLVEGATIIDTGGTALKNLKYNLIVRDRSGSLKALYTNYDSSGIVFSDTTGTVTGEYAINSISPDGYIKLFTSLASDDIVDISGVFVTDYYIDSRNIKFADISRYRLFIEPYVNGISEELQVSPTNTAGLLQIGTVAVNKDTNFSEVEFLDVRQRGGGINPQYQQLVDNTYPESMFYRNSDSFTTLDFMMGAGLIINVPGNLVLDRFQGVFSEENIDRAVKDSVMAGIGAVPRYYNVAPVLLDLTYSTSPSNNVLLTWKDIKSFSYRVHLSYDGTEFNLVFPNSTSVLAATSDDDYNGEYTYALFYDAPSSGNSLMYVKIEGIYTTPNGTVVDKNFSKTYRIKRV